jgi:hypothetical protein
LVVTRTFLLSLLAGAAVALAGAAVFSLPVHERFPSIIKVETNGGRSESFIIHWPEDRLELQGGLDGAAVTPEDGIAVLAPRGSSLAATELFRLRDVDDRVIGIASRMTGRVPGRRGRERSVSNWTLMIPSRGILLLTQDNGADVGPVTVGGKWVSAVDSPGFWATGSRYRISAGPASGGRGRVLGGTREFASLTGEYSEVWELEELAANQRSQGTIQLSTTTTRQR